MELVILIALVAPVVAGWIVRNQAAREYDAKHRCDVSAR